MIVFLLAIVIFLSFVHFLLNYNKKARLLRKIPGPKDKFIVGNALEAIVTPVELFSLGRRYAKQFHGIYRFWACPVAVVNIYNPEDIETIISNTKYNEKSSLYRFLKPWLRDGLLQSNGSKWQGRRKILTSAFHFNILRQFCLTFEENSRRLVDTLHENAGQSIDIVSVLTEFTLNSICETAMGTRLQEKITEAGKSYKNAINELGKLLVQRFSRVHLYSDFLFSLSPTGRKQKKYLDIIHNFTRKVIKIRKEFVEQHGIPICEETDVNNDKIFMYNKKKQIAMLDLLITAEKDGLIDGIGIQEEVDTFMFEGHDTTASGLTYCLMSIANNESIQDKIVAELEGIFGESTRDATIEDLSMMRYLECCIKESLRLYPPVPFISRELSETTKLSQYTVPPGVSCHIHIFDLHRREDLFKNPLVFDPLRFLPENSIGRHPYSYIPFSAGPRNCIGQKFAILEMKSVISAVLRQFKLLPVTRPCDLQFMADLVLRNYDPVYVKFVKRNV